MVGVKLSKKGLSSRSIYKTKSILLFFARPTSKFESSSEVIYYVEFPPSI